MYPSVGLAALTLGTSVAFWPGLPSAALAPRWATISAGSLLLLGVRVRVGPGHAAGLLLLLFVAASLLWTSSRADTIGDLWHLCALAAVFCVAAEAHDLGLVFRAASVGVSISVALALAQWLGLEWPELAVAGRPAGLFYNPNFLGEAGAIVAIGVLAWGLPLGWLAAPVAAVAISQSRGAWLALLVGAAMHVLRGRRWHARVLATALVFVVLCAALLARSWGVPGGSLSTDERLSMWAIALDNLRPLGWGLGTTGTVLPMFSYLHNEPIQAMFELGVGVLPLVAVLAWALGGPPGEGKNVLVAALVAGLFSFPMHMPLTALLVAVVAGALCGSRDRLRSCGSESRAHRLEGPEEVGDLGVGAPSLADAGRLDVPLRPQYSPRAGAVLSGARARKE